MTTNPGPGVDATGQPVIDPTQNVLDLVRAAIQRQDDLRDMADKHSKEVRDLGDRHTREIVAIRAEFGEKLREAESKRIDAIRAVDVGAVNRAAEVASTQAATLAAQVATSAETLRNQVAAAASAATLALASALEPIKVDIADLRKAQYEAQGQKTQVIETREKGGSVGMWIGVAVGAFGFLLAIVAMIVAIALP
jgi:sulfite reductase alpha subunit-like flavoprotein